jgi:hypothetical protein
MIRMRAMLMVVAALVALPAAAQQRLTRADLMTLADSGFALTMAGACGLWGDRAWIAEAKRRVRLLAAQGTPSRADRAWFDGAFAMAERRAAELHDGAPAIACQAVRLSGAERSYRDLMADPRLATRAMPPATED